MSGNSYGTLADKDEYGYDAKPANPGPLLCASILLFCSSLTCVTVAVMLVADILEIEHTLEWQRKVPFAFALAAGQLSLSVAMFYAYKVVGSPAGGRKMAKIASAIESGAYAFLKQEYSALLFVLIPLTVIVGLMVDYKSAIACVVGAAMSSSAGWFGMSVAVKGNVRTAAAAQEGLNAALRVAFQTGSVMGLSTVGLALTGLSVMYLIFDDSHVLHGFAFGGSTVALFSRVGGGIFTKAADVGTDLVGKVEANIPEDDPRNPGVIADNVGDNVGDVAGMGSDLFESYTGALVGGITLGQEYPGLPRFNGYAVSLPIAIAATGVMAAIIGTQLVRTKETATQGDLLRSIRNATIMTACIFLGAVIPVFLALDFGWKAFFCSVMGMVGGICIGISTEYHTSYDFSPTQRIAEAGVTGPATVVIEGFGVGLSSTVIPTMCAAGVVLGSLELYGPYGVSLAAVGMLGTLGFSLSTDAYGPVADNAGGIAEMAELPEEVRERTDALDALGNTTAAIGKGLAAGAAMLSALSILQSFMEETDVKELDIMEDYIVIPAVLVGGMLPCLFCAMTMLAVGKSAGAIIQEVRRQFRDIPGLLQGQAEAEYDKCVAIATAAALREMMMPGVVAVLCPVVVGLLLGPKAIVAMLMGSLTMVCALAAVMGNAGGAWDNAKKFVEGYPKTQSHLGGKGTNLHKATVVGDTVGDPFKDTSGPSLNILLNVMAIVSLTIAQPILNHRWFQGVIAAGVTLIIIGIVSWLKSRHYIPSSRELLMEAAEREEGSAE